MNATTNNGNTALIVAARRGSEKCVNFLINAGADVNMSSREGCTALSEATSCNSEESVRALLKAGADVNTTISDGSTILIKAAEHDNDKCVKLLLESGADVNTTDSNGTTALIAASAKGSNECIQLILKTKASAQTVDDNENNRSSTLQRRGGRFKEFQKSVMSTKLMSKLFRSPEQLMDNAGSTVAEYVDTVDKRGHTALITAAENGNVRGAFLLIRAGADVNICTPSKGTALSRAASCGKTDTVELLVKEGADVNFLSQDNKPTTSSSYRISFIWESENNSRLTALTSALRNGMQDCVELLIKSGADVNLVDGYGDTPLHSATKAECDTGFIMQCIKILLKAGAAVNRTNVHKQNSLKYYVTEKKSVNKDIAMLLFAAGETLDATTTGKFVWLRSLSLKRKIKVPDFLEQRELKFCLKHLCRETIRKHLLKLDPQLNLFHRIPQLVLPNSATDYLLYNMNL